MPSPRSIRPSTRVRAIIATTVAAALAVGISAVTTSLASADTVTAGGLTWTDSTGVTTYALDGAVVPTGEIMVQWERPKAVARYEIVEFVLDGAEVAPSYSISAADVVVRGKKSTPTAQQTEGRVVDVDKGHHWITARAEAPNGSVVTVRADFSAGAVTTTTTEPPTSTTTTTAPTTTTTAPTTTTTAPTTTTTTTAPPTTQPPATLVSVKSHGARGDGSTDDTAAVRAAFSAAVSSGADGVHFPNGTYRLTDAVDIPDAVRIVDLADGAIVRQHDNDSAFEKVGDVSTTQYTVTDARRGQRVITVSSASGLRVGDWFYFGSDDVFNTGKGYRRGFLRKIEAISGNQLTLDKALHHSLSASPRGWRVTLAPSVEIRGGIIEQNDPKSKFLPIVHLELVRDPVVRDTEIRNCGASGIYTLGTIGGEFDAYIHDCLDDAGGYRYGAGRHYGYGVEVTGPTRDLVVRGTSTRTRHAFTTNGSFWPHSDDRLRLLGEPEDVVVSMDVWETTSSGLDTHEPGWNIQFRDCRVRDAGVYKRQGSTDGKEGGFGMFIRSRATVVDNCVIERSAEDGLAVASAASGMTPWSAGDGPVITNTKILDTEGKRGTHFYQPAHVRNLLIDGPHLVGMHMSSAGHGSTADQVVIDLTGYSGSYGVIDPEYLQMSNFTFRGVTRTYG